jgi:hypothetical protein
MEQYVSLRLTRNDVGQILDGLEQRRIIWQATAEWLMYDYSELSDSIEECSDPLEAQAIAEHYQTIINTIRNQRDSQLSQ